MRTAILSLATVLVALGATAACAQTGNLRIKAKPGTGIVVNESYLGEVSPRTGRLVVTGIPAGVYTIRALRRGSPAVTRRVRVVPGRTTEVSLLAPARPTGDRTVTYPKAYDPPDTRRGRAGFHPPDTRPRPGADGRYAPRKKKSSFSMALTLPCVASPVPNDDAVFAGPGITATLRLSEVFALSASLFHCFEGGDLDSGTWLSLSAGPRFDLGGETFTWMFRPGLTISHLDYYNGYADFDSFGFGLSILTGPELRLGDRFSMGLVIGLEALLKAYEGEVYVSILDSGTGFAYWESSSSRFSAFFGLVLQMDF